MQDLMTIFRRELATYFNSAIGYIVLIVFVLISTGLFVTGFFQFPMADMRPFFDILPFLFCVFVPAVTMRLWAEERTENTVELLLTFPMRPISIVLGKFLAGFVFLLIALAATVLIPIMLSVLGSPDMGQTLSAYLGAVLLGGFFMALGLFLSGLAKDQIVAFVLALLASFGFFLLGLDFVAVAIDQWMDGLGSMLKTLVGVTSHYEVFVKGVFEVADLLYFLIWIAIFLFLNGLFIETRGRRAAKMAFVGAVVVCLALGAVFNALVADMSLGRFDLTEGNIYTVSEGSEQILSELDVPVQVKYYVTPSDEMPTEMRTLEREVMGKLEELSLASGGKLQYKRVHMHAANVMPDEEEAKEEEDPLEKRMLEKGVEPFSVQARRQTGAVSNLVYSSIGVAYKDKREEIIPRIVPASMADLEYQIVSTIFRQTREKKVRIAMVAPKEDPSITPQMKQQMAMMGRPVPERDFYQTLERLLTQEKYDVRRVAMTKEDPLPENYDLLMVIGPLEFNERQRWELARALAEGKPTLMAVQNNIWNYNMNQGKVRVSRTELTTGVEELLAEYGLDIDDRVLMDVNNTEVRMARNQFEQMFGGGMGLKLPMHILIERESMDLEEPIMSRLSTIFYMWGSAIQIREDKLKEAGLETEVLATTSSESWLREVKASFSQSDIEPPAQGQQAYPIFMRVKGQFPEVYEERPEWPAQPTMPGQEPQTPEPEEPAAPLQPAPGEMLLLGCGKAFQDDLLRINVDMALSALDYLAYGPELVSVRGKKPINRMIVDIKPSTAAVWKVMNYVLAPLLIAVLGLLRFAIRKRGRAAYAESLNRSA